MLVQFLATYLVFFRASHLADRDRPKFGRSRSFGGEGERLGGPDGVQLKGGNGTGGYA